MTTDNAQALALLNENRSIDSYLKAAQELVEAGHMPEISTLQQRVKDLCTAIEAAPRDTQQACLAEFKNLVSAFDATTTSLKAWKDRQA